MSVRSNRLQRVDLAQPLRHVLRDIARRYELGRLHSSRIITQGYDDLNVLMVCERGMYVAKFFNRMKTITTIEDHVRVQSALCQRGAPVPHILTPNGEGITRIPGHLRDTCVCVSDFFAGDSFVGRPPQRDDITAVVRFLATLHTLPLQVAPNYDSWGTLNLPQEFAHKRALARDETVRLVAPIAEHVAHMKFGRARRRVIHGDLQRKHVLKDGSGHYCILDFGCLQYSYPIVDLGVFLALFCLPDTELADTQQIITDVLDIYLARAQLPSRHIALLGPLILATWASYLLTADVLLRQGDRSHETRQWYRVALRSLRACGGGI